MAIDKELFYASHGLKYPVVARPYTDDITVQEKIYSQDEVMAMLEEIKSKITEKSYYDTTIIGDYEDEVRINLVELDDVNEIIIEKINALKGDSDET